MREVKRMEKLVDFENLETSDANRAGRSVVPEGIAARWSSCGLPGWSTESVLPELNDCAGSGDSESIVVMGATL